MIIMLCTMIQELNCNIASLLFVHLPFVRIYGISDCIHNCVSTYVHFKGVNLQRVPESDYSVTVGGRPCTQLDVNVAGTAITCLPPVVAQVNAPIVVSG